MTTAFRVADTEEYKAIGYKIAINGEAAVDYESDTYYEGVTLTTSGEPITYMTSDIYPELQGVTDMIVEEIAYSEDNYYAITPYLVANNDEVKEGETVTINKVNTGVYPYIRDDYKEWVSLTKRVDGSYAYVNKTSGTESGTKQNWGESGVFFYEINNSASFFTDGYKYIRMEIKVGENVNSLTLRFGSDPKNSYWIEEIKIGAGLPVGRGIYLYDADGKKAETLNRGEWYTLYIPVNDAGALNCLFTNGGSPETPATVYLKNLSYTKNVNESSSYAYIKEGTLAEGTGEFAGSRKLEAGTEVFFSGVTHTGATSGEECMGAFFGDGYKYLAMDIYFGENTTSISFNIVGEAFGGWDTVVYTFTIGEAIPENFIFVDEHGNRVTSIAKNTWYKVYFRADYTVTSGWTEFKLTIEGGEIYVKNVEFYKEAPESVPATDNE